MSRPGPAVVALLLAVTLTSGTLAAQSGKLSAEEIARLMDNPVGELIQLPIQYERISLEEPVTGSEFSVGTVKLIPTYPMGRGSWRVVNRMVVPRIDIPDTPLGPGVSGLGDITYIGAFTPAESNDLGRGKMIWAVGPTLTFPTAAETPLGSGKYQVGPAAAVAYLGPKATLGLFVQHWWSYAGDAAREAVNQTNVQYFWSVRLPKQWSLGASPSMTVNWNAAGGTAVNLPLGVGVNKTLFLGPLPVRAGVEASYYVVTSGQGPAPKWGMKFSLTPVIPAFVLRGG